MLRLMRDYATSWMIKFILGAIVIVFVFWGIGSFTDETPTRVAVVNDQAISIEEYRNAYNNIVEQLRQSFGSRLDDEMLKTFNVRKQAIDGLIDRALIIQEAEAMNMRVTDQELSAAIRDIPAFQREGMFDSGLYRRVLEQNRLTPEQFEMSQRKAMLADRMSRLITSNVNVADGEAKEWHRWQNAAVDIEYVLFEPSIFKDISPSDEEITAFFEKDSGAYETEPKVKVRYLKFAPGAFTDEATVTDEDIESYYLANPEEFKSEKTVQARHILLKLSPDATPEEVEVTRQKIEGVLEEVRNGADFGDMARQYSEGPSNIRGGSLGTFKQGDMVKPFSDKAFAMKAGEVSDPVRTRFGWHIIKVEKINEAKTASLEEATTEIRRKLVQNRAKNLAYDAAEAVFDQSFEGDDLLLAAEARGLAVETTPPITRQGPAQGVKNRGKFGYVAFGLPRMDISDIQDLDDGYYLLQVLEKIPSEIPELDAVKEKVTADVVRQQQDQRAREAAEGFLKQLQDGKNMAEAASGIQLTPARSGYFKRNAAIPDVGYEPALMNAAFELSSDAPLAPEVLKGRKGYFVVRFSDRKYPAPNEYEAEKDNVVQMLTRQKQQKAHSEWLARVRDRSNVEIEEAFIE